ncbi:hypothetical protein BFF78_41205 [Streptomyces fodineus]|uniref:Uncharacterized protein n=1 Tax=Streptomyces fodineus TaxID=1904616 RepID=A0A1D7YM09_9ACTN|nr:hypothetical protein [Streptomyces fodineus]AOR36628.1 hypothetical protein BFF78_41205 [Streptomyces fodineus]
MAGFQTPEGAPRIAVFDAAHARVLDTWSTTGLRGTGSHDFEVADQFVPERHTFGLVPRGTRQEPLHLRPTTSPSRWRACHWASAGPP